MSAAVPDFFPETPIQRLDSFCGQNEIFIKRDDLLPFCFGGNKARIATEFVRDMVDKNGTCMVAYGSTRSNLSRTLACACSTLGIRCVVICPSDIDGEHSDSFNEALVRTFGAEIVPCSRDSVRRTVASTLKALRREGENPYYIYGNENGKGNEVTPGAAYEKVHSEILQQEMRIAESFDIICLATGTGMTQAGLIAGEERTREKKRRIIGFSVARSSAAAVLHISDYVSARLGRQPEVEIEVVDKYLHGGYGLSDGAELQTIARLLCREGVPADETYVGKAFDGMLRHFESNHIEGQRVLFIHTGGTPLFFDNLKNRS